MEIPKKLQNEIWEYCRENNITDVEGFITKMVKQGFTVEKYGATPYTTEGEIKEIEVIKEVPVEKIKEVKVEVIKEVPVEVTKEVYITDDKELTRVMRQMELKTIEWGEKEEKMLQAAKESEDKLKEALDKIMMTKNDLDESERQRLELQGKLEEEQNKPRTINDIYKEGRVGFYGSDTRDLQT